MKGDCEGYEGVAEGLEGLAGVARELCKWFGEERLVRFISPMGSGKTTLISALCRELGVRDRVSSPTFAIMNEYVAGDGGGVYHFDFYRIESPSDLQELGLGDALNDERSWRFVEWPAVGERLMPAGGVDVSLEVLPGGVRRVRAEKRLN